MRDLLGRMKSSFWVFIIRRSGFLTALLEGYENTGWPLAIRPNFLVSWYSVLAIRG